MPPKQNQLPSSLNLQPMAGRGRGCGNPIGFTIQHQDWIEWCWAANAVSVNLYYHPASGQTQCALANIALGQTTCCVDGSTPECNQPWFLDQALQLVGNLNAATSGKIAMNKVKSEIDNCRPLCMRIGWTGGGGHFTTVYGYAGQHLYIGDPWYGNSVVTYQTFPSTYQGGGTWTDSYTTQS